MLKSLSAIHALFFPAKPTPLQLAKEELEDAQRALLKSQSDREYAEAMVQYNARRVSRLTQAVCVLPAAANESTMTPNQAAIRTA